jgi:hypothetical protein
MFTEHKAQIFRANNPNVPITGIIDETSRVPAVYYSSNEVVNRLPIIMGPNGTYITEDASQVYIARKDYGSIVSIRSNGLPVESESTRGAMFVIHESHSFLVLGNKGEPELIQPSSEPTGIAADCAIVSARFADKGTKLVVLAYDSKEKARLYVYNLVKLSGKQK